MINAEKGGVPVKKQPQITAQTKANLRDAFWQLYSQKPIEKISIKEITDLAGYNRGTFYLYYKDAYDLLWQIEEELLQNIAAVIRDCMQNSETFDISQQMGMIAQLMQTHYKYSSVLFSDHGDPQFSTKFKELLLPLLKRYVVLFGILDDYHTDLLIEFLLAGILASVSRWIADPKISIEAFVEFMVPMIFPAEILNKKQLYISKEAES